MADEDVAIPAGFEPATHGVEIRYSIQLSYGTVGPSYHEKHEKAATRTGQKCGNGPALDQERRTPVASPPLSKLEASMGGKNVAVCPPRHQAILHFAARRQFA